MKTKVIELTRQTKIIQITVEYNCEDYRFELELQEAPNKDPFISHIHYLDRWEKDKRLKNSEKRKIRAFINQQFKK